MDVDDPRLCELSMPPGTWFGLRFGFGFGFGFGLGVRGVGVGA